MSRPSAPGVSVDVSGAAKVAARRLRRLGKAILIDFTTEAGTDSELMAWYRSRSNSLVRALQLRQERAGPYFHQFVVFELQDDGGLFRIDRRLRPNEDAPMNSLKDEGIPAYDTIEPVVAWDDPLFPASDCLISIEFKVNVYLALILKICRTIQEHPLAKVYTLQRYNCYFFAQTIILWTPIGAADWASTMFWYSEWILTLNSNKGFLEVNKSAHKHAEHSELGHTSTPTTQFTYKGYTLTLTLTQETYLPQLSLEEIRHLDMIAPSWEMDDVRFMRNEINISIQHLLETYWKEGPTHQELRKYLMHKNPSQVYEDLSSSSLSMPRLNKIFIEVCSAQETLDAGQTGALWFLKPSHERIPPDMGYGPSQQKWSVLVDSFGIHLDSWEQWMEVIDSVKCWEEYIDTFRSLGQVPGRIDNTFIDLFEQSMAIRVVYGAIVQRGSAQETSPNFNMEDVPRYRRPRRSIFGWRKAKQEQEQQMTPATIIDMQKYLIRLIDAHSIRVEQYKWATKAIATDVASDIKRVADEVWSNLIEFS